MNPYQQNMARKQEDHRVKNTSYYEMKTTKKKKNNHKRKEKKKSCGSRR